MVSRASPARTGQRGVYEYPCTVSSKPRSERDTVATGNCHTSAAGETASSTSCDTDISGQNSARYRWDPAAFPAVARAQLPGLVEPDALLEKRIRLDQTGELSARYRWERGGIPAVARAVLSRDVRVARGGARCLAGGRCVAVSRRDSVSLGARLRRNGAGVLVHAALARARRGSAAHHARASVSVSELQD